MSDQDLINPTAGQADWDSSLNANFTILGRGQHVTGQAGVDINTGEVLWLNSGNFAFPFDPNSLDVKPHAFAFTAASSGDDIQALAYGIVRSLGINSPVVPGAEFFVSPVTPGVIVGSYSGADRPCGVGVGEWGILFNPHDLRPERITQTTTVTAVTGSLHYFSIDGGQYGWVREVEAISNSVDLLNLTFHSGSARVSSELLYDTISGGAYSVTGSSFWDRAGWPYENTEANTISGLIFGTVQVDSAAAVGSDGLSVRVVFDRIR